MNVGDRAVATTHEILEPTNDDISFPIDFVWTWLDDADAEWSGRRDEHLLAAGGSLSDPHVAARFVNRDELKYSMRSAAMYAPWVGTTTSSPTARPRSGSTPTIPTSA